MARKKKHEEHVNHERWLISYADFITLLFAFFVVMYSVSSVNEGKFRVLSDAMIAAFRSSNKSLEPIQVGTEAKAQKQTNLVPPVVAKLGNAPDQIPDIASKDTGATARDDQETPGEQKQQNPELASKEKNLAKAASLEFVTRVSDKIETAMANLIEQKLIAVRRGALWVEVEINTSILFSSGSAVLQKDALPVLKELANILKEFPNPVRVEGFTDSVPINTLAFPSNWELSAGRAASVVHLFTTEGLEPTRMAAIGFGQFRPVADNTSAEGRNRNRRVVIIILESAQAERIFSARDAVPALVKADTAQPVAATPVPAETAAKQELPLKLPR